MSPAPTPPTPPTPEQVAAYVGADDRDLPFATEKTNEAKALVDTYLGAAQVSCPEPVYQGAIKEVASKLWGRRGASDGQGYSSPEGVPFMPAKDPMVTVYAVLDRFKPGGFA